jgi:CRP-like cAMP-binding protein
MINPTIAQKNETFFAHYQVKRFSKGQIIIYAGDEPAGIFYLTSGNVRQYDIDEKGNEIVVNVFKPGAFFPMSWGINKTKNNYFFDAMTAIQIRQAPTGEVVLYLKENPDVMYDLLSRLYSGVDGLQRRMAHLMGGNARNRLIFELIIEFSRFGKVQLDGTYITAINETELAQRTGLSRETVNREFKKLKDKGILSYKGKNITVKNVDILEDAIGSQL